MFIHADVFFEVDSFKSSFCTSIKIVLFNFASKNKSLRGFRERINNMKKEVGFGFFKVTLFYGRGGI